MTRAISSWSNDRQQPKLTARNTLDRFGDIVQRPFSQKVVVAYGLDLGDRDAYLSQDRLSLWNVSLSIVHEISLANLEAISADLDVATIREAADQGLVSIGKDDAYDASRILLPRLRARLSEVLGPEMLAFVPDRSSFIVWRRQAADYTGFVDYLRQDLSGRAYPLTDEVFALAAEEVRVATPADLDQSPKKISPLGINF